MDFWSREGNLRFCPYLLGGNFFDYFLDWRSKNYEFLDIRPSPLRVLFHFRASRSKKASKLAKMSNWLWQPKNDPQNRPLITIWSPKYKKMLKLAYQVFKVPNSDQKWGIWAYLSSQIFGNKSTYLLTYYVSDTDGCSNRDTISVLEFDLFTFFTFPGTLGAAKPPIQAFRLQKSVQKHHIYGHLGDSIIA